jgi:hypothetical protein
VFCQINTLDSLYKAPVPIVRSPVDSIKSTRKVLDSLVKDEILKQMGNN